MGIFHRIRTWWILLKISNDRICIYFDVHQKRNIILLNEENKLGILWETNFESIDNQNNFLTLPYESKIKVRFNNVWLKEIF